MSGRRGNRWAGSRSMRRAGPRGCVGKPARACWFLFVPPSSWVARTVEQVEPLCGRLDVLVATSRKIHHDDGPFTQLSAQLERSRDALRRFDSRDDAFSATKQSERI